MKNTTLTTEEKQIIAAILIDKIEDVKQGKFKGLSDKKAMVAALTLILFKFDIAIWTMYVANEDQISNEMKADKKKKGL